MELNGKQAIINASTGDGWYPKGSERLKRSLNYVGWGGDYYVWFNRPNKSLAHLSPYTVKVEAFEEAIAMGKTHILWCDSSVWAIKDPMPIFDIINDQGYFFWKSGFNCAQVCSDKCLDYFHVDRDTAETYPDCSTSIFGVNLNSEIGYRFITDWMYSARAGAFEGSRLHDNQSQDPRFLFHRQDQACASLIAGKMGLSMQDPGEYCSYFDTKMPESVILALRGM